MTLSADWPLASTAQAELNFAFQLKVAWGAIKAVREDKMKPATMIAWATCATALAATTAAVAEDDNWTPDRIKSEWVGKKVFSRTANGALADFWMRDDGTADVAVGNNFTDKGTWWLSDGATARSGRRFAMGKSAASPSVTVWGKCRSSTRTAL
ncbi:MAG: hypothetical protein IPN37_21025 [Betaproteobacteria bacterium]|nr:hypothetical protein [Betaproteobacteria bacterium]